jgi:hypothetical protein
MAEQPENAPYHQLYTIAAQAMESAASFYIARYRAEHPYDRSGKYLSWEWIWSSYDDGSPEDDAALLGITVGIMTIGGDWRDYFTLMLPDTL